MTIKIGFDAKRAFFNSSGLGNYSRNIIFYLLKYFPENEYYLFSPSAKIKYFSEINNYINVHKVLPDTFFSKFFSNLWRNNFIYKDINNCKLDVYHGLSNELPYTIPKNNLNRILTVHDLIFIRYPNLYGFIDRKIYAKKMLYSTKNADTIIAISEQTKQDLMEFMNLDPKKIKVVYQGCNNIFKIKSQEAQKQEIARKYNLPKNFILNVGTIEPRKNILSVIMTLNEHKIDVPLVIIGRKTDYYNLIQKYIFQHNLSSRIIVLDKIPLHELPIFYQIAECFIYPSIFEGFGIPIIEAINSGTPVITNKFGCFKEAAGENSIFVDPDNHKEIAEAINILLTDSHLRKTIISKSYEYVKKFDDHIIADNLMTIYKNT